MTSARGGSVKILINNGDGPKSFECETIAFAFKRADGKVRVETVYDINSDDDNDFQNTIYMAHTLMGTIAFAFEKPDES